MHRFPLGGFVGRFRNDGHPFVHGPNQMEGPRVESFARDRPTLQKSRLKISLALPLQLSILCIVKYLGWLVG